MKEYTKETQGEMTATEAILKTVQELADKCKTLDEFRQALEKIIKG